MTSFTFVHYPQLLVHILLTTPIEHKKFSAFKKFVHVTQISMITYKFFFKAVEMTLDRICSQIYNTCSQTAIRVELSVKNYFDFSNVAPK